MSLKSFLRKNKPFNILIYKTNINNLSSLTNFNEFYRKINYILTYYNDHEHTIEANSIKLIKISNNILYLYFDLCAYIIIYSIPQLIDLNIFKDKKIKKAMMHKDNEQIIILDNDELPLLHNAIIKTLNSTKKISNIILYGIDKNVLFYCSNDNDVYIGFAIY
jgi:hypothetical protein